MQSDSPRNRVYRAEGIVLSRLDIKEADRILTVYTPHHGRIRCIAKGARKPTSHLGPHLELFNRCLLGLARGRDLDTVTSVEAMETREALRTDLLAYASASHIVEVLNSLVPDAQANPAGYQALARAMRALAEGVDARLVCRHFELQALTIFGFKPELTECVNCRKPLAAEPNYLSGNAGGFLCPACQETDSSGRQVSVNAQKVIRTLDRGGLAAGLELVIRPPLHQEVEQVMLGYLRIVTERELKSLKVLRELHLDCDTGPVS